MVTEKQSIVFMLEEPLFFSHYYIEYRIEHGYIMEYEVYPAYEIELQDRSKKLEFEAQHDSNGYEFFDKDHIRCVFTGNFRWRGVWDNRIYFPDGQEYRDDEFIELASFYRKILTPWAKDVCRKLQPELDYHGE